jgi:hypothetical protein
VNCLRCEKPIEHMRHAYLEVVGFAKPTAERTAGTGSSLIGRRPSGRVLCPSCGTNLKHGVKQDGLF